MNLETPEGATMGKNAKKWVQGWYEQWVLEAGAATHLLDKAEPCDQKKGRTYANAHTEWGWTAFREGHLACSIMVATVLGETTVE